MVNLRHVKVFNQWIPLGGPSINSINVYYCSKSGYRDETSVSYRDFCSSAGCFSSVSLSVPSVAFHAVPQS